MAGQHPASEVCVRLATLDDVPAVASIHVRSWQRTYRGQVPDAELAPNRSTLL